jgi:hypothetical protein
MMKILLATVLLLSSLNGGLALGEPSMIIYTLPVQHRTPESLLGALSAVVDPGGTISVNGNKFIIRTTAENFQELAHLVDELDTPAIQLLISVRQQAQNTGKQSDLEMRGNVTTNGRSLPTETRVAVKRSTGWGNRASNYQLRAIEGEPVRIQTGQQIPIQTRYGLVGGTTTQYHPIDSGVRLIARLIGDQVLLNVTQQQQRPIGENRVETQELHTQVRGRLGEWIQLGGVQRQSARDERGIIHYQTTDQTLDTDISVKIEKF